MSQSHLLILGLKEEKEEEKVSKVLLLILGLFKGIVAMGMLCVKTQWKSPTFY